MSEIAINSILSRSSAASPFIESFPLRNVQERKMLIIELFVEQRVPLIHQMENYIIENDDRRYQTMDFIVLSPLSKSLAETSSDPSIMPNFASFSKWYVARISIQEIA